MAPKDKFTFTVNGALVEAERGQTIAEAMLAKGLIHCRTTRSGEERGVFCAMGACFECRMIVDGQPNVRTCMTPAGPGLIVETQDDASLGERDV